MRLTVFCLLSFVLSASASLPAFDSAVDPAYDAGWANGTQQAFTV